MKFKIGDNVFTVEGGRFRDEGPFSGVITGFSKWKHYDAANVKKRDKYGDFITVQCLIKNLIKIK